jgi:hypothetical protein
MSGSIRSRARVGRRRSNGNFNIDALEEGGSRGDHRVMRSGKAENAVCATGRMVGKPDRRLRRTVGIVCAEYESLGAWVGIRHQRESAKHDKQRLHANGVR